MTIIGSLTAQSPEGTEIRFHPEGSGYETSAFTAPSGGVYRFTLFGAGGYSPVADSEPYSASPGGAGGKTVGYLLMKAGETVYIGAGGCDCMAFVSKTNATTIDGIGRENMLYIAGAGGEGALNWGAESYDLRTTPGGVGGGWTGASSNGAHTSNHGIGGGLEGATSGGMQSVKDYWYENWDDMSFYMGYGGDGYFAGTKGAQGSGGGGGSGYCYSGSTVTLRGETFTSTTEQGTGSGGGEWGWAMVALVKRDILPIYFDGTPLTEIFFNGVKLTGLVYNGVRVFIERVKKRCLKQVCIKLPLHAAIRE